MAILIAAILTISIGGSIALLPNASAHTPAWQIPTYAYIEAAPHLVGVGQSDLIYCWLAPVYGAAGGASEAVIGNAYTTSAALLANDYRFDNYKITITAPNGAVSTQTFAVDQDPTSSLYITYTPNQVGTYNITFSYPGQVYGANGDGYSGSVLVNDTYLPSSASTTLTVQSTPIAGAITGEPLPTNYWSNPIYGENSNWYTISSNWLGTGTPVLEGYTSSTLYHGDNVGPLTGHIMWETPLQFGGTVGGNYFPAGGSDPSNGAGVQYYEGSSYQPRFSNPIIINGYLFYTQTVSFTGPSSGPTVCVNLQTGQQLWSSTTVPPLSFAYIYNLWDPDQHGTYPPILVAAIGGGLTGLPSMWECFDAYTGDVLFNITGVPGFAAPSVLTVLAPGQPPSLIPETINGQIAVALTYGQTMGPSGEVIRDVFMNDGTAANPNWYLAEWNMSKIFEYDINPYTGGGSYSPSVMNASNGWMVPTLPIPIIGETGTAPSGASVFIPYGSTIIADASTTIAQGEAISSANPSGKYDWNVSIPWLNTMPLQATYNPVVSANLIPAYEQGTAVGYLAEGGNVNLSPGVCPTRVLATDYGDAMLCENGTLPTGFKGTSTGYPQLPYTLELVNLNATVGPIGSILWMQTYNPPAGNLTMAFGAVDWQTRIFYFNYEETLNWAGYSLTTGDYLWTTAPQNDWDYYGLGNTMLSVCAYGNIYSSQFGGITYCMNDVTGKLLWTYGNGGEGNTTYAGYNVDYGDYPTCIQTIAGGVVYLATSEHTINNPIYKGAVITAINATTGQQLWTLSDYPSEWSTPGSAFVAANGYIACMNGYNNMIYSIGRGPSATTVEAPQTSITALTSVAIQGTVMDTSAGSQLSTVKADFPGGVPAASDASMPFWMAYVYDQQPEPTNFTGVTVTLTATDPNGNFVTLGSATTDAHGMFHFTWTPPDVPGTYSVTATFAGTNGYWGSSSETNMVVQGPSATAAPTPTPASGLATMTGLTIGIAVAVIAIIIAIAIVGLLLLRKKP